MAGKTGGGHGPEDVLRLPLLPPDLSGEEGIVESVENGDDVDQESIPASTELYLLSWIAWMVDDW